VRVVLDANVLVAAVVSRTGAPAALLAKAFAGELELVASELIIAEVVRAAGYKRLRSRIRSEDVRALVEQLRAVADVAQDVADPPSRSSDPDDDYLVALAARERGVLVSGDKHLLALADLPIYSPRAFLELLEGQRA
jgi:uncharacterized protein